MKVRPIAILAAAALAADAPTHAQIPVDDLRVRQIEAELRQVQRDLDAQRERIAALERAARSVPQATLPAPATRTENTSPAWLVTANWERIRPGMKPAEVIAILGRPTSTRLDEAGKLRTLFYAMEIGRDSILAGNILMDDAGVVEINRPVLK